MIEKIRGLASRYALFIPATALSTVALTAAAAVNNWLAGWTYYAVVVAGLFGVAIGAWLEMLLDLVRARYLLSEKEKIAQLAKDVRAFVEDTEAALESRAPHQLEALRSRLIILIVKLERYGIKYPIGRNVEPLDGIRKWLSYYSGILPFVEAGDLDEARHHADHIRKEENRVPLSRND